MTAFDWSELTAIYTRRTLKVAPLSPGRPERRPSRALVAAAVGNLARTGYSVSPELIQNFLASDTHSFLTVYRELSVLTLALRGGDVDYEPMYPNFPTQVAEADEVELLLNALFHYAGNVVGLRIMPVYSKDEREDLKALQDRQLTLGSWDGACALLGSIMSATQPFTDADVRDLRAVAAEDVNTLVRALPETFPVKENLVHLTMILREFGAAEADSISRFYRTATDVLRLAVALSDGNPDLSERRVRFASFKRADRRLLLGLFEQAGEGEHLVEDMQRRPEQFKRLAERLHPGEFSRRFPRALAAFTALREGELISTYNSKVEAQIEAARIEGFIPEEVLELLATRPGDFARRLDHVLRLAPDAEGRARVVEAFAEVAHKVAVKVLLQLGSHYLNRDNGNARIVIAKGGNKVVLNDAAVPFDDEGATVRLVVQAAGAALRDIFATRPALGKVWVDPELEARTIPVSVQNASESMEVTGRFTRTPIAADVSTLRFFIHWKDSSEGYYRGTDVDLSALFLNEEFGYRASISYQNLRQGGFAVHSGDITSAPQGAAEFIDVDIEKALAAGVRYVVQDVRVYSNQHFAQIPECYAGFMGRTAPGSGEIFEPSTVKNKATLTSETTASLLYVFDLRERVAVWVDASTNVSLGANNLTGNLSAVERLAQVALTNSYLSLRDLFLLHGAARGEVVESREEADVVFGEGGAVAPGDAAQIMSEWM